MGDTPPVIPRPVFLAATLQICVVWTAAAVDFRQDIQPLLADRCFACHGPDTKERKADLRLDLEEAAKKKAVVANQPDASELFRRITSPDPQHLMPPPSSSKKALTPEEVALIRAWITEGAKWEGHWAYTVPVAAAIPEVAQVHWPRNEIDYFVLSRMEKAGLSPSGEADRETLVRRLYFDLTGLPPALGAIDAFVAATSTTAYEELVDSLLASPAYGEHLSRAWLDGARYADTNGYQNDFNRSMWPWRDWVINAYNTNMPYDQFVVKQLAGDLLPNATDEDRIATGFNRNNSSVTEGGALEEEWHVESVIDRVNTTATVFMGLTMGCARCHDHKYDPITQKDFYSLYAFFNSTEGMAWYLNTPGNVGPQVMLPSAEEQMKLNGLNAAIRVARQDLDTLKSQLSGDTYDTWLASLRNVQIPDPLPLPVFDAAPSAAPPSVPGEPAKLDVATIPASAPASTRGVLEPAMVLDGTSKFAPSLADAVSCDTSKPFSVSLWIRPDTAGILLKPEDKTGSMGGTLFSLLGNGAIEARIIRPEASAPKVRSSDVLKLNTWAHLCFTYDGSGATSGMALYLDSTRITCVPVADAPADANAQPVPETFATGAIAGLQRYDKTLSQTEVRTLEMSRLSTSLPPLLPDSLAQQLRQYFEQRKAIPVFAQQQTLDNAQKALDDMAKTIPSVMVMQERAVPHPTYLLRRGAYDAPDTSTVLAPKTPAFLPAMPSGAPANRLGLAQWLVDPANPLTARVAVNHLWQMIFGRGLVKTADDFGVQGSPPTHPELLDTLAVRFQASGWNVKALLKDIVMSSTYRQSSNMSAAALEADPDNDLYARAPRYRFTAEMIRDNALAVSGLLSQKVGGPSVKPYQPPGVWEELQGGVNSGPYVQSTGEDLYRRSLYTFRKRTIPHPTLSTFDAPSFEVCVASRSRTNTPLQALTLLNDITYVEAARHLAQRMLTEVADDVSARLAHGFRLATGRRPTPQELDSLTRGYATIAAEFSANAEAASAIVANGASAVPAEIPPVTLAPYTTEALVLLNLDAVITRN